MFTWFVNKSKLRSLNLLRNLVWSTDTFLSPTQYQLGSLETLNVCRILDLKSDNDCTEFTSGVLKLILTYTDTSCNVDISQHYEAWVISWGNRNIFGKLSRTIIFRRNTAKHPHTCKQATWRLADAYIKTVVWCTRGIQWTVLEDSELYCR